MQASYSGATPYNVALNLNDAWSISTQVTGNPVANQRFHVGYGLGVHMGGTNMPYSSNSIVFGTDYNFTTYYNPFQLAQFTFNGGAGATSMIVSPTAIQNTSSTTNSLFTLPGANIFGVNGGSYLNGGVTIPNSNSLAVTGTSTLTGAVLVATSTLPTLPSPSGSITSLQFAVNGNANISSALIVGVCSTFSATSGAFPSGYSIYAANGILTEKVKIASKTDNINWSDFVFNKNYKLRSLNEVEKFISKNHHLPEIPSQEEVNKNGVDLLEMDAKLLQKIEELTLYMIEMKKENELMKKKNEELESKVNSLLKN